MKLVLTIFQIIISLLLIISVLLQSQGQGLGALGGGGEFFQSRRGFEKLLFYLTIVLVVAFLISSLVQFWLS